MKGRTKVKKWLALSDPTESSMSFSCSFRGDGAEHNQRTQLQEGMIVMNHKRYF